MPGAKWGQQWRSSPLFIVIAMAMALFTDTFLYTLVVPILPYMLEYRLDLDASLLQTVSFWLLAETAGISVILSIPIGHYADRIGTKRLWLLWALGIALVSTLGVALATSTFVLFASRLVQAIASSIIWVVGFATIADNIQTEHLGKTYGAISMAIAAGASTGPMLSGILFQVGGYWLAWSSAFVVICIDIVLRLLMLERPYKKRPQNKAARTENVENVGHENDPLLPGHQHGSAALTEEKTGFSFYKCLFSQLPFIGGTVSSVVYAIIHTSFDSTLPLHVRDAFHWGSMPTGMMFLALQGPGFILSPFVGWLKDRIGTRYPTTFAFAILAPFFWLLGVPGDQRFPWANEDNRGPVIYTVTMIGIGVFITLLNGAGTMEATLTVNTLEKEHPGIFGPNGGYSRALSICSTGWTVGSFIGPILSGLIKDYFAYYEMSCTLTALCALSSLTAFICLVSKKPTHGSNLDTE